MRKFHWQGGWHWLAAALIGLSWMGAVAGGAAVMARAEQRPNVLWITCEDLSPLLGCYGDANAHTPRLDAFRKRSVLLGRAFATAPVCSPARSGLITGQYAASLGSQNLRSDIRIPAEIVPYPKFLRQAGYYATNNVKEDYNFTDPAIWDVSSAQAHWQGRGPGQPFFAIFNLTITHQSQIFGDEAEYGQRIAAHRDLATVIDPAKLVLPPYYPDTPEVRKLWARYYTNVAIMDRQFGARLDELEAAGLAEDTIVFFFSDHGTGMPRGKRSLYDSGLQVPLLVHVPERWARVWGLEMGGTNDALVSFLDLPPTLLSVCGLEIPAAMPGKPFLGPRADGTGHTSVYGTSDRVDEGFEVARTVRTARFRYLRNYFPHLPLLQPNFYTDQSNIMRELARVRRGLAQPSGMFASRRAPEELYDTQADPHQMTNLAGRPEFQAVLEEHRRLLRSEILSRHDTGFMLEPEMLRLAAGTTPWAVARDPEVYPLADILAVTDLQLAGTMSPAELEPGLSHPNGLLRFWALVVAEARGAFDPELVRRARELLADPVAQVRIEAARYLLLAGQPGAVSTLVDAMESPDDATALYATRAFELAYPGLGGHYPRVERLYQTWEKETAGPVSFYRTYAFWSLRQALGR